MAMVKTPYQEHGYRSRMDYLESLAHDFHQPFDVVWHLAEVLGENEDFDELVVALEDML